MPEDFLVPGLEPKPKIDTTIPQSARIWNYWLGGKDNYPVDWEAGDEYLATFPGIVDIARQSRAFLARAVRFLAGEAGVRQFLDIGTGLPTVDNTHEVAQRVTPDARIVYVDNDPLVLVRAQALLTSTREGACHYIDADLREPGKILAGAAGTLDFSRPVALMLMEILGHVSPPRRNCGRLRPASSTSGMPTRKTCPRQTCTFSARPEDRHDAGPGGDGPVGAGHPDHE